MLICVYSPQITQVPQVLHKSELKMDAEDDEDDEDDEEDNSDSEDDPDRLWCICKRPHNNRFMICCDVCEDWFHGKCVHVSKAMGEYPKSTNERDKDIFFSVI